MFSWLMGNLCDKSMREEPPTVFREPATVPSGLGQRQSIHSGAVNVLAKLGNSLLSGCKDGNLAIFDCASQKVQAFMKAAHERELTAAASTDGCGGPGPQLFATGSRDKSFRLWSLLPQGTAGQQSVSSAGIFPDAHDLVVSAVSFNAQDGNQVITGSRDNTVKLWDAAAQKQIGSASVSRNLVTHIRWAPNSHQFLQASEDKELKLWDSRTLKVAAVFPRKQYIQTCCDVSPDGAQCVSSSNGFGGNGCEATVWDMRTKKPLLELVGHAESVLSVRYYGSQVCTGSADSSVRLWDPATGQELARIPLDGSGPINSICSFPSLGLVGAATFNTGVCLCRVTDSGLGLSHQY